MDERKEDVHRLVYKEIHPHGRSPALESLFQRYSSSFLAEELLSLYNIYCGKCLIFFPIVKEQLIIVSKHLINFITKV